MSNDVTRARNHLASLFTYGRQPDPEAEADARRSLAYAKLQRAVRDSQADAPALDPGHIGHLVGLLLAHGENDGQAVARLESAIRAGAYSLGSVLAPSDRERLAAALLAGAER